MSGLVKVLVLLFVGLALGVGYNAWPIAGGAYLSATGTAGVAPAIDIISYATGITVGMLLWQLGSVPWVEMPVHVQKYLASKMEFYQLLIFGGACIGVLLYL